MLRNFFTTTYRNLVRNSYYTVINALGLSIGIASCIVIFLVVQFETSFDTFHSKYESIYRIVSITETNSGTNHNAVTPYPFSQAFRNDFSDIPLNTQFHYQSESQLAYGNEKMKLENFLFADSLFFDVFDFGVLSGNPKVELAQPGKAFATESLLKKIGNIKTIKLDNKLELEVVGIVQDPPANSHLTYSMVVSWPSLSKEFTGLPIDQWGIHMSAFNYVVLPQGLKAEQLEQRLIAFADKYMNTEEKDRYYLQPLHELHFDDRFQGNGAEQPSMTYTSLTVLIILGAFILLVACVNYINLSTALAVKKSREIGVRKTLGANEGQLARHYLMEALLVAVLSMVLSIILVEVSIGEIGEFLQKKIELDFIANPAIALFLIALLLVTALLSGLYPALVLSRFKPAEVLKNKLTNRGSSGVSTRKYLVMFQFLVAQVLIIGTLVVANQMNYFQSKPLGFIKEAIVNVNLPVRTAETRSAFHAELTSIAAVERVSFSVGAPTSENSFTTGYFLTERGKEQRYETALKPVDINYLDTYGLNLVAGKWFSPNEEKFADMEIPEENRVYNYVVNEAMVRQLGFSTNEEIIGKKITTGLDDINALVIGVVSDFHTSSLHEAVKPTTLVHFPYFYLDAGIRFHAGEPRETLASIEKAYAKVFPDYLFEYSFLDEHLASLYKQEERTYTLVRIFAGLAILISCLGLLGLVSFMTQQKVKEIGVRKVFGASVHDIVFLFSKSFLVLIILSFLVAAPVAWYAMTKWLSEFAYKSPITLSIFAIALSATLIIALVTVSFQSIKAAMANPATSLRSE
jgi:putative ABC transport system permease protein